MSAAFPLDVDELVALLDPVHTQHDAAHAWFGAKGRRRWATCPLTEAAVPCIVGHPRHPNSPGSPAPALQAFAAMCALPGHEFWPDDVSLRDEALFDRSRLLDSGQVTDSDLLGLAAAHGGRLVTFDRRLVADAVRGGCDALVVLEG